jgi:hypothetical protein
MSNFVAQRVKRSHVIHLPATIEEVFPLFEPLGEKHWAHGWDPEMLYPASGIAEEGTVFTTQHAGEPAKIWTIIAYERERAYVAYFNVLPQSHTSRIDVRCEPAGERASSAHITYTLTALTESGNSYLAAFTQEHYRTYIDSWQTAIAHYLLHELPPSHKEG